MKIKTLLIIVSLLVMSVLTKPTFVKSQQTENCDTLKAADKKSDATESEKCLCEQNSAVEKPTYTIGESPFGIKTKPRKPTSRTRRGVAASPGAIERTAHTKLLGKLEIPNKDDLSSPEVAGLQKQLLDYRAERRKTTEEEWKRFLKYRVRANPSNPILSKRLAARIADYNHFEDLQNTDDWQRLPKFDWRERGLEVGAALNQGKCGSCWAFASVSAYQSSWELE